MAIVAGEIKYYYSTTSGSAGNSLTQGDPNASLGKYVSTTEVATGLNGLFDDVTGAENSALDVEYRCVFVKNTNATTTLQNAVAYITTQVSGGTNVDIAIDNIGPVTHSSSSAQAALIANEGTAPTGTGAFSAPTTIGTGLALGNIAPNEVKAIWVRRTATDSAPLASDGFTLSVAGDTL